MTPADIEALGFHPPEWSQLSTSEKKIVLLVRKHGLQKHEDIRRYMNFPLEDPIPLASYKSMFSRLQKKVRGFTQERARGTMTL